MTALPFASGGKLDGLRPSEWICVGAGFSREDVKSVLLTSNNALTAERVTSLLDLSARIVRVSSDRWIGPLARQEVLRLLLTERRILAAFPELKRLKRQGSFFKKVDHALQSARMAFAHSEEEEVLHERLDQHLGPEALRDEMRRFCRAYESWCQAGSWWDLPMLLRAAIDSLEQRGWPAHLRRPERIWLLTTQTPESLERAFWEKISTHVEVVRWPNLMSEEVSENRAPIPWEVWHSLDDAAESLAESLGREEASSWTQNAVLIPDNPVVRRVLKRALSYRKIPLADPRDPTRLRWEESVKWSLLPLECVALDFERERVVSWIQSFADPLSQVEWVREIQARGIRRGISSYAGGVLAPLHARLMDLKGRLGGRQTPSDLAFAHLKILNEEAKTFRIETEWVSFMSAVWTEYLTDLERVGRSARRVPARLSWERLKQRVADSPAPVSRLKPEWGVPVYRLHQAPWGSPKKVWALGLPAHWLDSEGVQVGDFWLNERCRDVLAAEFGVRSTRDARAERLRALRDWGISKLLDAQYDWDGKERESLIPILREVGIAVQGGVDCGAHARWQASFGALRPLPPQVVSLPALPPRSDGSPIEITATALDRMSRCSFQALATSRWKLQEMRKAGPELWPDVKGNLLHEAARWLIANATEDDLTSVEICSRALEEAWRKVNTSGLFRGARIESYARARLLAVLMTFGRQEQAYRKRAGTRPVALDNLKLSWGPAKSDSNVNLESESIGAFIIKGTPDRIDEHPDGLFVIDYKTSGLLAHGSDMLEKGYRLQLPFYALAAQKWRDQSVLGVQFVDLSRKGGRSRGIFFSEHNGSGLKKTDHQPTGILTTARKGSKSLILDEREAAWKKSEAHIVQCANDYIQGQFEARPRAQAEQECAACWVADLCGFRRRVEPGESGTPGEFND